MIFAYHFVLYVCISFIIFEQNYIHGFVQYGIKVIKKDKYMFF